GTRPPRLSEIPAFVDHIARDWGHRSVPVALPEGTEAAAAEHRRRLSHALPGRAIVAAAGTAPIRNDDSAYGFRADSDFVWLTGVQVEGAVLVMTPTAEGTTPPCTCRRRCVRARRDSSPMLSTVSSGSDPRRGSRSGREHWITRSGTSQNSRRPRYAAPR